MKRLLIIGALAAASAFTFAAASNATPGTNSGSCTLPAPHGGPGELDGTPLEGQPVVGDFYGQGDPSDGNLGIGTPPTNYLEWYSNTSGGSVSGRNGADIATAPGGPSIPKSGANGSVAYGASPSACVGVAGKGGVHS